MSKVVKQILLELDQLVKIQEKAEKDKRSFPETVRNIVDEYFTEKEI